MRLMKPALLVLAGAMSALVTVVACGDDDGPITDAGAADAAACDCPPIEGRIRRYTQSATVGVADSDVLVNATCPIGGTLLGGACWTSAVPSQQLIPRDAIPSDGSYECRFINLNNGQGTVNATAICLVPEGTP
jgi:hypothetical protein